MTIESIGYTKEGKELWCNLKSRLPAIANELGAQSIDELQILDYDHFPNDYMVTHHRDKPYKTEGIINGLPFVQQRRMNTNSKIGYGLVFYENRMDKSIKYALFIDAGQWGDDIYLVVKKEQMYRLRRNAGRLNRLAGLVTHPPILEEGMLEELVRNTIGFLKRSRDIEKYGVKIKRGIILDGSPGNGKTMACKYIQKLCSQNEIRYGVVTSAEIDDAYKEKQLDYLFNRFDVTFFDDIDVGYMDRGKGNGKMACSLLTAMDGMYEGSGHVIRIFTTNEMVDELDAAFTRPGRIDKRITFNKPDAALRRKLIDELWPQEIKESIDVNDLVERSDKFSFAEVEAIRTFLVTEKVLGTGKWDLDVAFEEYDSRSVERKKGGVGFSTTDKKKKRK